MSDGGSADTGCSATDQQVSVSRLNSEDQESIMFDQDSLTDLVLHAPDPNSVVAPSRLRY